MDAHRDGGLPVGRGGDAGAVEVVVAVCSGAACGAHGPDVLDSLRPVVRRTPRAVLIRSGCLRSSCGEEESAGTAVVVQPAMQRGAAVVADPRWQPCELVAVDADACAATVSFWLKGLGRRGGVRTRRR